MSHPKEMVIFFAILFTEKALLNFCYSVIYYLVAERVGFLHSSPHQWEETIPKNKFLKWQWTSGSHSEEAALNIPLSRPRSHTKSTLKTQIWQKDISKVPWLWWELPQLGMRVRGSKISFSRSEISTCRGATIKASHIQPFPCHSTEGILHSKTLQGWIMALKTNCLK